MITEYSLALTRMLYKCNYLSFERIHDKLWANQLNRFKLRIWMQQELYVSIWELSDCVRISSVNIFLYFSAHFGSTWAGTITRRKLLLQFTFRQKYHILQRKQEVCKIWLNNAWYYVFFLWNWLIILDVLNDYAQIFLNTNSMDC